MKQILALILIGILPLNSLYSLSISPDEIGLPPITRSDQNPLKLPVCVKYYFEKVGNRYEEINSFKYGSRNPWYVYWDETDNVLYMDGMDFPIECKYIGKKHMEDGTIIEQYADRNTEGVKVEFWYILGSRSANSANVYIGDSLWMLMFCKG